MPSPNSKPHTTCRACGSDRLDLILDLGEQPLANQLAATAEAALAATRYPLRLLRCAVCTLGQLDTVVDPTLMFTDYRYRSGTSQGWHTHCLNLATSLPGKPGDLWLDIGCNDGTMLDYASLKGYRTLGVDPAPIAGIGNYHSFMAQYWSDQCARIAKEVHGSAQVITAMNVFGHVDDAADFLLGIKTMLAPDGVAIIESPDGDALIRDALYDTVYHEHLSYWTPCTMGALAARCGLRLADTDYIDVHGGTIRYHLHHIAGAKPITWMPSWWEGPDHTTLQARAEAHRDAYVALLQSIDQRVWGYGAAAKTTVLLNFASQAPWRSPIIVLDDNPAKADRRIPVPGGRSPWVAHTSHFDWTTTGEDYMILYPWNWGADLIAKLKGRGYRGKFISLRPTPRIL